MIRTLWLLWRTFWYEYRLALLRRRLSAYAAELGFEVGFRRDPKDRSEDDE